MNKKIIGAVLSFACFVVLFVFFMFNFVMYPSRYSDVVDAYCHQFELDNSLVYAIIKAESNFNANAVSNAGAIGLMQIMPITGEWIASELSEIYDKNNLFSTETNIKYGTYYLSYLFKKFKEKNIVICAYNAGEGNVSNWIVDGALDKTKITFAETKKYLDRVNYYHQIYKMKQK